MKTRTLDIDKHKVEVFLDSNDAILRVFLSSDQTGDYGRLYAWEDVPPYLQDEIETRLYL